MAKKNYEKIRSILKEKGTYEIDVLAKKLGMNEFQTKEYLLNFLYSELSCIDTKADHNRYKYLYKIFKYFEQAANKKELEIIKFNLEKCSKLCKRRISRIDKDKLSEDSIFRKLQDTVNVTYLGIGYLPTKEENVDEVSYKLLDYIIYDLHNYNYLFELLKTFPQNLAVKNKNGEYLIETLVDKYIETVIHQKCHSDIIYYEKIIKLFINDPKFYVDKNLEKILLVKLKNAIKTIDELEENIDKKKAYFFLSEVISDINQNIELTDIVSDIKKVDYKYEIKKDFSSKELRQASRKIDIYDEQVIDLTDKYTITIDKESTWVYDDAISLEILPNGNYLLGIYVADATKHIRRGSNIDLEAFRRSETIYLPKEPITMLPYDLTKKLSLSQSEPKGAIGVFFELTKDVKIVNVDVKRCVINVNKNYSYDEVDSLLQSDSNIGIPILFKEMYHISTNIQDMSIYGTKYRELKKIKKNLLSQVPLEETINPSCNMIAQFMIEANATIANFFDNHPEIPFIYRINLAGYSSNVVEKIKEISRTNMSFEDLISYINYIIPPSVYSTINFGHNGLKLDAYCHFTNPLRNYASLETQRLVVEYMINDGRNHKKKYDKKYYENLCNYMNSRINLDNDYLGEIKQLYKRYDEVDKK